MIQPAIFNNDSWLRKKKVAGERDFEIGLKSANCMI
jgi:hypothetical protein